MTLRKCMTLLTVSALCLCLTACKDSYISPTKTTTAATSTGTTTAAAPTGTTSTTVSSSATKTTGTTGTTVAGGETDTPDTSVGDRDNGIGTAYPDKEAGFQLEKPAVGEQIVILHTTKGDVSIRLFPEAAPKAVENFVTHVKNGYFDGQTFYHVVKNDYIESGDPTATGKGGESIYGADFEDEFDSKLLNLTGALSMANRKEDTDGDGESEPIPDSNGSRFIINHGSVENFGDREVYSPEYREAAAKDLYNWLLTSYTAEQIEEETGYSCWEDIVATDKYVYDWIPDEVWDVYEKHGGNVRLDGAFRHEGGNAVFGQVFEGLDVVDTIASVVVDSQKKPLIDVVIKSAEVTTYQG